MFDAKISRCRLPRTHTECDALYEGARPIYDENALNYCRPALNNSDCRNAHQDRPREDDGFCRAPETDDDCGFGAIFVNGQCISTICLEGRVFRDGECRLPENVLECRSVEGSEGAFNVIEGGLCAEACGFGRVPGDGGICRNPESSGECLLYYGAPGFEDGLCTSECINDDTLVRGACRGDDVIVCRIGQVPTDDNQNCRDPENAEECRRHYRGNRNVIEDGRCADRCEEGRAPGSDGVCRIPAVVSSGCPAGRVERNAECDVPRNGEECFAVGAGSVFDSGACADACEGNRIPGDMGVCRDIAAEDCPEDKPVLADGECRATRSSDCRSTEFFRDGACHSVTQEYCLENNLIFSNEFGVRRCVNPRTGIECRVVRTGIVIEGGNCARECLPGRDADSDGICQGTPTQSSGPESSSAGSLGSASPGGSDEAGGAEQEEGPGSDSDSAESESEAAGSGDEMTGSEGEAAGQDDGESDSESEAAGNGDEGTGSEGEAAGRGDGESDSDAESHGDDSAESEGDVAGNGDGDARGEGETAGDDNDGAEEEGTEHDIVSAPETGADGGSGVTIVATGESGAAESSGSGGGIDSALMIAPALAAAYWLLSPDSPSFSPEFNFSDHGSDFYRGRLEYGGESWTSYVSASRTAGSLEGGLVYETGGRYAGSFWDASYRSMESAAMREYEFFLGGDLNPGMWNVRPNWSAEFAHDAESFEWTSSSALGVDMIWASHQFNVRKSAGLAWNSDEDLVEPRVRIDMERRF